MSERRVIDANAFNPDHLADLPDDDFRAVVEADLRRRAPRNTNPLRDDLVAALRTPALAIRWHATLARMQKSVDGQLGAREGDFRAEQARLEAEALQVAQTCQRPTSGDHLAPDEVERHLAALRMQQSSLRADYQRTRASTLRFKTGLDDAMLEARYLRDEALHERFGDVVAAERDHLATCCRRLCGAIESHRTAVLNDLGGDDADEIDTELWAALRSATTEHPHDRGSNETHACRDNRARRSDDHAGRLELVGPTET